MMKHLFGSACAWLVCATAFGAEKAPEPDLGPTFSGTIRAKYPGANNTMKGLVVTLDREKQAYICYDTDLMRVSLGWTGDFLKFGNYQREIVHPQPPEVAGRPVFGTLPGPGWSQGGKFADSRAHHQGPLPRDHAKHRGLYLHGESAVLSYTVGNAGVLESPGLEWRDGSAIFTRSIQLDRACPEAMLICDLPGDAVVQNTTGRRMSVAFTDNGQPAILTVAVRGIPDAQLQLAQRRIILPLKGLGRARFQIALAKGDPGDQVKLESVVDTKVELQDLAALIKGGPARWKEPVGTHGALSTNAGPYVVDAITEPLPNPWNARTFFGGFDFLSDGRAAICTFHGDVWLVSGLDAKLDRLTWKRFATGMFQPLGLKVVDDKIYVTCRDQITRLHDLNGDDEADFYENFNNDTVVTANYHEFCMDLHTDRAGNFYYAKGSPWPPDVKSPHQGCLLKVSKDGAKLEVYATGLRAPNGMGLGPNDEITVSDNQGHWMPASKLNWVKQGGFYGMMQAAHRDPRPVDFDRPICWLPMSVDSSSGGQAWVTSERWGPLKNHMLFTSYGKGTLFHVMHEEVDGRMQGAMTQFPLKFNTGIMRARFNPHDGQLYVCGLRGWQTSGLREGGFYRVRYTGVPVAMASGFHPTKNGLKLTFTAPLDVATAKDVENYSAERWNYKWSGDYGSPEFSPSDPKSKKHEPVNISSVDLSADRKSVFLRMPDLAPVDQLRVKLRIAAKDGTPISQDIYGTIYKLANEQKLTSAN